MFSFTEDLNYLREITQTREAEIKKSKRDKKKFINSVKRDTLTLLYQTRLSYDLSFLKSRQFGSLIFLSLGKVL